MSSRLPETDLANWAFLSRAQKRDALDRHVRPKQIIGSYEPFRQVFGDVVNKQLPLFDGAVQPATPWETIESRLRLRCRTDPDSLKMNLEIAKATHTFAEAAQLVALPIDVTSIAFGVGHLYQFGLPMLMRYPDRVAAVFLDLRRSNGISVPARDWVFLRCTSGSGRRTRTWRRSIEKSGATEKMRSDRSRLFELRAIQSILLRKWRPTRATRMPCMRALWQGRRIAVGALRVVRARCLIERTAVGLQ